MARKLPIAEIARTSFYVDVLREELRQTDDAENRISFNELFDSKGGYSFIYDTRTKNVPENGSAAEIESGSLVKVTLPALMELDPVGIAEKYGIPIEILASGTEVPVKINAVVEPFITKRK
jgi:hypothetical protein